MSLTKDQELALADDADAIKYVLEAGYGRKFVWDLLIQCGIFATTFAFEDTHTSAFNEGKRQVGLQLLQKVLTEAPNSFTQMRDEHMTREANYEAARPEQELGDDE